MTYDSIKKSYKTFVKLLFVSDSEECEKNIYGLYAFTYALTDYLLKNGYTQIFNEPDIQSVFGKINVDVLKTSDTRRNALISLTVHFPIVMDFVRANYTSIFEYISNSVLLTPHGLELYRTFNPRSEKTMYAFFLENNQLKQPCHIGMLYNTLNECHDFDINQFMVEMVANIPSYSAFHDADVFMNSFIRHLDEMSVDAIKEVVKIYKRNSQCTNRGRHTSDMNVINKYLEEQCASKSE